MTIGVFVIARNGVADMVAVYDAVGEICGTTVGIFASALVEHPINGTDKPMINITNKILRFMNI
jgi:hypothetical protein